MPAVLTRPLVARTVLLVFAYWIALFAVSVSGSSLLLLRLVVLTGFPLLLASGLMLLHSVPSRATDLAYLDDLTGLHNRRAFTRRAMALIGRARPGSVSLVLIDVDGLKSINDDCGHLAGDELLEQVAEHLRRVDSTAYRVGGDEFAILVDRSHGEGVAPLMASLTPLTHVFRTCGHEHLIQLSYGFASKRELETFEQVFARADERLRQFKTRLYASGRKTDRRIRQPAAAAESRARLPEAVADGSAEEGAVVSIFSRSKSMGRPDARSGTTD